MNQTPSQPRIAHLDAFTNPFTGKPTTQTRCGICDAALPLPGEYPMMIVRHEPNAKLYDHTGDPGTTEPDGKPRIIQTGITIERPICWHHAH
jgi:hypothetical protein